MHFPPTMITQPGQIQIAKEILGVLGMLKNPHAIQNIYRIEDGLLRAAATKHMIRHLKQDPNTAKMIERRHLRNAPPEINHLRHLPRGTLGQAYADHIDTHGFNPAYYQPLPVTDDTTYALARVRETHDIWHVLTGFHPTPIGEIGLKAFELAQLHRPMSAVIVAGGLLRYLMIKPAYFADVMETIATGYQMGLKARPLLAEDWESQWETPLTQLTKRLKLTAIRKVVSPRALGKYDHDGVKASLAETP